MGVLDNWDSLQQFAIEYEGDEVAEHALLSALRGECYHRYDESGICELCDDNAENP